MTLPERYTLRLNITPVLARKHGLNGTGGYPIFTCQRDNGPVLLFVPRPNLNDLIRSQFRLGVRRPMNVPTLLHAVALIVCRRAEKEMRGVNASGRIAMMANGQTIRNRSVRDFPRRTMRSNPGTIARDSAIPAIVHTPGPKPTLSRTSPIDATPESLFKRWHGLFCVVDMPSAAALSATETSRTSRESKLGVGNREHDATRFARAFLPGRSAATGHRTEISITDAARNDVEANATLGARNIGGKGKLVGHSDRLLLGGWGAMPRAVDAAPGLLCTPIIPYIARSTHERKDES